MVRTAQIAVKSCKCSGSNHGSLVLSAINISSSADERGRACKARKCDGHRLIHSMYPSLSLSVSLSVCLSLCLSVSLSLCLSVCLSVCLYIYNIYIKIILWPIWYCDESGEELDYIYIYLHIQNISSFRNRIYATRRGSCPGCLSWATSRNFFSALKALQCRGFLLGCGQ